MVENKKKNFEEIKVSEHFKKFIPASLVAVVRDEEDNILYLLNAIKKQTFIPMEIIIVDGGSVDNTVSLIENFKEENKNLNIKIIRMKRSESNIPIQRNRGVKEAKYDIIIGGDAGVKIPDIKWIEKLYSALEEDTDFVAGVYRLNGNTEYQKAIGDVYQFFSIPDVNSLNEKDFHPSNRSFIFRKKIWEVLGGYKEDISRGEDTWFSIEAKKKGFKMKIARDAEVVWYARNNLREVFKFGSEEARSDVRLRIDNMPRYKKYYFELCLFLFSIILSFWFKSFILIFLWFFLNEVLLALLSLKIVFWSKKFNRIFYYFLTVNTIFFAYLYGILKGKIDLFKEKWKKKRKN